MKSWRGLTGIVEDIDTGKHYSSCDTASPGTEILVSDGHDIGQYNGLHDTQAHATGKQDLLSPRHTERPDEHPREDGEEEVTGARPHYTGEVSRRDRNYSKESLVPPSPILIGLIWIFHFPGVLNGSQLALIGVV